MLKVGDKVRCIRESIDFTRGNIYKVMGFFNNSSDDPYVIDDAGDRRSANIEGRFELVKETPIRTVTRREIVPHVYGIVKVGGTGASGQRVPVSIAELYYSAEELRNAAKLLNEIAEVLEDA